MVTLRSISVAQGVAGPFVSVALEQHGTALPPMWPVAPSPNFATAARFYAARKPGQSRDGPVEVTAAGLAVSFVPLRRRGPNEGKEQPKT